MKYPLSPPGCMSSLLSICLTDVSPVAESSDVVWNALIPSGVRRVWGGGLGCGNSHFVDVLVFIVGGMVLFSLASGPLPDGVEGLVRNRGAPVVASCSPLGGVPLSRRIG